MTTSLGNRPERPAVLKEPVAHPVTTVMISLTMAAKKTEKLSKSAFIRQHPNLSTGDVIAKGKEAGLKFTSSLVYMVRGPKEGTPKKTATKTASKKTASEKVSARRKKATSTKTAPKKTGESKAGFVRARSHLSPKEIVEDAKSKGLKLDASYVYNVRGYDKATASKKQRASKRTPTASKQTTKVTTVSPKTSGSSVEDLLEAAAAELGLGRAIEVLQGERARVTAVLGGAQ